MKRKMIIALGAMSILLTSCAVFRPSFGEGQYSYATSINGYWDGWKSMSGWNAKNKIEFFRQASDVRGFIIYPSSNHPSEFHIAVSYNINHERKEGKWYVYDGAIEYYVKNATETFPFKDWNNGYYNYFNKTKGYKKISNATVKIYNTPAKEAAQKGATLNVFFEGNAIGIMGVNNNFVIT